jgi:hypothetical protein
MKRPWEITNRRGKMGWDKDFWIVCAGLVFIILVFGGLVLFLG